ncbi:hypothetical protein M0R45_016761 [Rubus argutus]|uniref:Uncharacterized protein n=1 Tax=Rubus argutus TaxID=59490 RepID=A0AAW1XUG9_RUBAR
MEAVAEEEETEMEKERLAAAVEEGEKRSRLITVASKIMGGNGVINRSIASSLRLRAGMGLPVGKHIVPDRPLPVNDELVWDNDAVSRTLYRSHRRHHTVCPKVYPYDNLRVELGGEP